MYRYCHNEKEDFVKALIVVRLDIAACKTVKVRHELIRKVEADSTDEEPDYR